MRTKEKIYLGHANLKRLLTSVPFNIFLIDKYQTRRHIEWYSAVSEAIQTSLRVETSPDKIKGAFQQSKLCTAEVAKQIIALVEFYEGTETSKMVSWKNYDVFYKEESRIFRKYFRQYMPLPSEDNVSSENQETPFKTVDLSSFEKYFEERNVFAVGYMWDRKEDKSSEFFERNIWVNGKEDPEKVHYEVAIGDVLVMKTFFIHKGTNRPRIKIRGIGVVQSLESEKQAFSVWWDFAFKNNQPEFEDLGAYPRTIQRMSAQHIVTIVETLDKEFQDHLENAQLEELEQSTNSALSLQKDTATLIDELGRQPFVNAMAHYIGKLWASPDENDSYTIHLNGEWGSGKSTFMRLLKQKLEAKNEWLVVDYNAWQHQHINVPWWIFMDNVFKAIKRDSGFFQRIVINIREYSWRIFSMNAGKWYIFLIFLAIFLATSIWGKSFLEFDKFTTVELKNRVSIITSAFSLIGTLWLLFYGLIHSLLPGSESAAKSFKEHVRDPMDKIKRHYKQILQYSNKHIAVFIDDIDRCNPEMLVLLLEGLQTLFRKEKALYLIAGDSAWIRESFEIHYKDLKETLNKPGQSLGNFFVEKTLQHSIYLPAMTEDLKKAYWNKRLGATNTPTNGDFSENIKKVKATTSTEQLSEIIKDAGSAEERSALREAAAAKVSSEEIMEDIEHELLKYYELLDTNPRRIKRLVNDLALQKVANILSGLDDKIDEESAIRWAILRSRFPLIAQEILKDKGSLSTYISSDNITSKAVNEILKGFKPDNLIYMKA